MDRWIPEHRICHIGSRVVVSSRAREEGERKGGRAHTNEDTAGDEKGGRLDEKVSSSRSSLIREGGIQALTDSKRPTEHL